MLHAFAQCERHEAPDMTTLVCRAVVILLATRDCPLLVQTSYFAQSAAGNSYGRSTPLFDGMAVLRPDESK